MAKVTGPLLSLDASGTVAGAMTFAKWKGRNYIRQRVIPANPQSAAQTGVRSSFAGEVELWKANQVALTSAFDTLAKQSNISAFNAFTGYSQKQYSRSLHVANAPDVAVVAPSANITSLAATVEGKYLSISWTDSVDTTAWATEIYAKLSADPTGIWSELISIRARGNESVLIGPLASGTWHINGQAVDETGGVIGLVTAITAVIP
jgi:hypothetical protein